MFIDLWFFLFILTSSHTLRNGIRKMKRHPTSRFVSLLPAGSCFNDSHQRKRLGFRRKYPREEDFYGCGQPMPSGFTLSQTKRYFPHVLRLPSCDKFNLKHLNFFKKRCFSLLIPRLKRWVFSANLITDQRQTKPLPK